MGFKHRKKRLIQLIFFISKFLYYNSLIYFFYQSIYFLDSEIDKTVAACIVLSTFICYAVIEETCNPYVI